jgi:hypothetical protein
MPWPKEKIRVKIAYRCFSGDFLYCYIKATATGECASAQEDFERTFAIRNEPEGMVLARAPHTEAGYWHLIWLSAARDKRALYLSFKLIEPEALPGDAELLAGDARTFEKLFACRQ